MSEKVFTFALLSTDPLTSSTSSEPPPARDHSVLKPFPNILIVPRLQQDDPHCDVQGGVGQWTWQPLEALAVAPADPCRQRLPHRGLHPSQRVNRVLVIAIKSVGQSTLHQC